MDLLGIDETTSQMGFIYRDSPHRRSIPRTSITVTNEVLLMIEAYFTLRDRGPYPADQVIIKDLDGSLRYRHLRLFLLDCLCCLSE
ncbi:Stem-specific protein TSJT1 [Acorus calamus]|uniref:Stem-specific protein TSJT1 n=1 Tax=Acorus calamus TaxID=4465 RepID=A0AAV9EV72_ACOCL|nr:Stem-specific protein TSJT1 [Acorus calamus]